MADLKAQIAANEKGVQELRRMVDQFGLDVVQAYMRHVQDNAEESVRSVITRLKDGAFTLPLDNGAQIQVAVRVNATERTAEIDLPAPAPSCPTTSTLRGRCAWRRCCTCSAAWFRMTSR
jgi:5-oxoprolinase (ATP-hydrolysing)